MSQTPPLPETGLRTLAVHAGESPGPVTRASSPNLVMSTTFVADRAGPTARPPTTATSAATASRGSAPAAPLSSAPPPASKADGTPAFPLSWPQRSQRENGFLICASRSGIGQKSRI
jgi:hypothetical protein